MDRNTSTIGALARYSSAVACMLALTAVGCGKTEDPKVAELEQQLKATQDQLAAAQATTPIEPVAAPATAAPATAPATAAPAPAAATTPAAPAAKPAPAPAKASTAAAKPPAAATARPSTAPAPPPGVTQEQYAADKATARGVVDEQRSVNATQASTNSQVQQQIEELKPIEVTIPSGTVIATRTTSEVSTNQVKNGSSFDTLLERDLVVSGTTVARKGARVTGFVVESDPGGKVKGTASMAVSVRSIEGPKGALIAIRADNYSVDAASTKKKDVTRTGIMTGAGAVIGAIAGGGKGAAIGAGVGAGAGVGTSMATRGDPAVIPAETLMEFRLTSPVTVSIPR